MTTQNVTFLPPLRNGTAHGPLDRMVAMVSGGSRGVGRLLGTRLAAARGVRRAHRPLPR